MVQGSPGSTFPVIKKWLLAALAMVSAGISVAQAAPTRAELYRSDRLKTVVYKDSQDADVYWYLPPLKLYEDQGKIVYYRRAKDDKVVYYFYVVPYMTDELVEMLAGEIPGLTTRTQLKPLIAKQFGIQVKQFEAVALGEQLTDYHYLNQPHLIRIPLTAGQAEEFEFFLNNKPGIQANVLFYYDSEKVDKYLTIELSYKEVYNALNIGATGQYKFTRAEIEKGISSYLSKKYLSIKSKGDLPIPDVVNKAIEECFTPSTRPEDKKKKRDRDWDSDWFSSVKPDKKSDTDFLSGVDSQSRLADSLVSRAGKRSFGYGTLSSDPDDPIDWPNDPDNGNKPKPKPGDNSIEFTFKKELATSDKAFFFKQEHFADSSEIVGVPIYLSLLPASATTRVLVEPLEKKELVVEHTNEATKPYRTGIMVKDGEQFIINAVFALQAKSFYNGLNWWRWDSSWPNVNEELYYRVGTGPWTPVNGRAIVKAEGIYKGELQFMLDRKRIWEKLPGEMRDGKALGFVPAILTYQKTYPQFNVVVTGRQIQLL